MFDSLKKRLKDAVKKVSGIVYKSETEPTEKALEREEKLEQEVSKEIERYERIEKTLETELGEPSEAKEELKQELKEVIDDKIAELEEVEEKERELKKEEPPEETMEDKEREKAVEYLEKLEKVKDIEKRKILRREVEKIEEREGKILEEKERLEKLKEKPKEEEQVVIKAPLEERPGFFKRIFKRVVEKTITESDLKKVIPELQKALLENDVALEVAEKICEDVKKDLIDKKVKRREVEKVIKRSLRKAMLDVMKQETIHLEELVKENKKKKKPFLIIFLGFNGTGKTTTIAKLAYKLKRDFSCVLAAGDTFRAASIEQLGEHAKKLGIKMIKHKYGADSAAVIFDAVKHAKANDIDVVLADTAGRSHKNVNLMDELKKICRVNKPDMKILVLDSLTGNDIYDQTRLFNGAVGVDAIILTKTDVYQKGGAALSASYTINKRVLLLGTGQEYDDLKPFYPEEIVNTLLSD
jgi:fused signal recognition particle receptor